MLIATTLIAALCIIVGKGVYRSRESARRDFMAPNNRSVEQAVREAHANLGTMALAGRVDCRDRAALPRIAEELNALQGIMPEDGRRLRKMGSLPPQGILHVANKPTGPWQVVLVVDREEGVIHVEGYGDQMQTPGIVKSIACPSPQ